MPFKLVLISQKPVKEPKSNLQWMKFKSEERNWGKTEWKNTIIQSRKPDEHNLHGLKP